MQLDFICAECGSYLDAEVLNNKRDTIAISCCESCISAAKEEASEEAKEAYEESHA